MSTGNPELDLIAATVRQAVKDAQCGHGDAIRFLDDVLPEWQRWVAPKPKRPRRRKTVQEGQNAHDKPVLSNDGLPVRSVSIASITEG